MNPECSDYADYLTLHDQTLPHFPWELYQRWKSYGKEVAIVSANGEHTSYRELVLQVEGRYDALGEHDLPLRSRVSIGGAMCVEMVTTVVACWLRGLTVVLLDDKQPEARQKRLLGIAAPRLVVNCHEQFITETSYSTRNCTYKELNGTPQPISSVVITQAAYIVFTSGSTGEPKAILGSHDGLAHFISWQSREFSISQNDRLAQLTAIGFDVIYRSVWTPLFAGARLYLPPYGVEQASEMLDWIRSQRISAVHLVPCIIKAWLASCSQTMALPDLRYIFSAGEMLQGKVLRDIRRKWASDAQIVNLYGPSETTLAKSFYRCRAEDEERDTLPVGCPLPNTEIRIMIGDQHCRPNQKGEVVIRTPYRALGYLAPIHAPENDHGDHDVRSISGAAIQVGVEVTFRPTPNAQHPEDKLYYTGDLGHYDETGRLFLHGRVDGQIKINGVRIEPGEIEALLQGLPQVDEAAVCLIDESRLVAYLAAPESLSVENVDEALYQAFPAVMRPQVVICRCLPQNANGKLDRQALKSMSQIPATTPFSPPVGTTESLMAELWHKHLAVDRAVGRHDDFFSLGGNSISAIVMGAELNRRISKQVPLKLLFQHSRLSEFCEYIDREIVCYDIPDESTTVRYDRINANEPFGLTDVQRAYLLGRDPSFELGGVSTHNYREDRFTQLDVGLLTWCVSQLVVRHPSLRTVYSLQGSQRVLAEPPPVHIAVQDLRSESLQQQRDALLLWREELEHQIFDASVFPLFEFRVTQRRNDCILHFSYDVLIMDALSMSIFAHELGALYRQPQYTLPPLDITPRDYQLATQTLMQTTRYQDDRQYWLKRLPELPPGPALATACRPDHLSTPKFGRQSFKLDAQIWQALQDRTRKEKVSTTVPFLELYGQVLAKWSTNEHFLINLTLFQREDVHPDTQRLIGDFTVLSLYEYKRQRQKTARQSLHDVQAKLWDDLFHTLFTGVQVQSELAKQNQMPGNKPVAPVVLTSMLGYPTTDDGFLSDEHQGRDYARTQTSQVWLDNNVYEKDGGIAVEWDYVCQLFDEQQISDMLEAYRQGIIAMAKGNWDQPIDIPLPPAHTRLLKRYNDTACQQCVPTKTLHQQFLLSAKRTPQAPAVISAQGEVTSYEETRVKSTKLSQRLQASGVTRHDRVMICAEKGSWLIPGILGILMAGCAFVPVNIKWPVARLRSIMSQASIRHVVITSKQLQSLFDEQEQVGSIPDCRNGVTYHLLDDDQPIDFIDTISPVVDVSLESPAYIIFTSGSTGHPKGVRISHGSVMNTLRDINKRLMLASDDRTLCLSNMSFDLAIYDMLGPLLLGSAVVMPDENALDRPESILRLLCDQTVSIYNSAPGVMALLIQSAGSKRFENVRYVLLSGDFIPLDLPGRINTTFPRAKILSLGGATEGSIWSISYPLGRVKSRWTSIPYGMPLHNQQVWILDAHHQPCPMGVSGEIYLAGHGVALGYEADAEKTAAHFGVWPDGKCYYRTGDGGVMRWDGYIEILGRLDQQVKVNGFRIELGEIDTVLQTHPAVQTSLSRVVGGASKSAKSLVSYVVPHVFDRLAFKLQRRGIRDDVAAENVKDLLPLTPSTILADIAHRIVSRKSYRHFHQGADTLTLETLQTSLLSIVQPLTESHLSLETKSPWASLAVLLSPLRALKHEVEGLGKYLYPSAGGLYPVRTYVTLSRACGKSQGHYYYQPDHHALVPLVRDPQELPDTGIYLQLNAYLPAIEPEYHDRAQAYAFLEAGCMSSLLAQHIALREVQVKKCYDNEDELLLTCYRLEERKTTEKDALKLPESTLLLLKTVAGWQVNKFEQQIFEHYGDVPISFDFGQDDYNDAIIGQASALLLLPNLPMLDHGRLVQCLSEHFLKASIGSCLLGQVEMKGPLPTCASSQSVFHCALAIGKVTAEVMTNGKADNGAQTGSPALSDELRAYLMQTLPYYMVPSDIISLQTLPLTPNGKVDVKALPLPRSSDDETCPPRGTFEERLQVLWTEVLAAAPINNTKADFFLAGGSSLEAILLAVKIGQRFARKVSTAFVYKHRTISQQARAIVECVLQPTQDHIALNETSSKDRLVLFSPSDSGAEAYYALAQALSEDIHVVGINNFFINYPDKVTADWSVALEYYCHLVLDLARQAPQQSIWLGGWSMGGNVAVAVAEKLADTCPQLCPQLILLDSRPEYGYIEREERENPTDVWSNYHPDNVIYQQFAMAGYSKRRYYHYLDCLYDHLHAMQVDTCRFPLLVVKCLERIGHYYSEEADNGWGKIAGNVNVYSASAHHMNLLIDKDAIQLVADVVREAVCRVKE